MPLKTKTGIEGTFLHKKKPNKEVVNVNKTMHVGLGRQLKEAKVILTEEDAPSDCFPPCRQELPKGNFLEVVLLAALGVRKCHSCKGQLIEKSSNPQKIWVFLYPGT